MGAVPISTGGDKHTVLNIYIDSVPELEAM